MQSSGSSDNSSEPPQHRWAEILGTTIAVLTLTLPFFIIAHYSSNSSVEYLPETIYSMPETEN